MNKKHKVALIFLFICILGIPIIIHILFKFSIGISFFEAEWSAGEALGYYGDVLSFLGTVALGILALYQNDLIKRESDKRIEEIEHKQHEANMPKFSVEIIGMVGNGAKLHFVVKNISQNIATKIKIWDVKMVSADYNLIWICQKELNYDRIYDNYVAEITLDNPNIKHNGDIVLISMSCEDMYNKKHMYLLKGTFKDNNKYPDFVIIEK